MNTPLEKMIIWRDRAKKMRAIYENESINLKYRIRSLYIILILKDMAYDVFYKNNPTINKKQLK